MPVARIASVCEILVFRLMSDAGVLEVRRGVKRKEREEIAGNCDSQQGSA